MADAVVRGPERVGPAREDRHKAAQRTRRSCRLITMTDETAGVEKQAKSVALPAEDGGEQVIAQQNAGPEAESGSGEWPSPATAATGPAPGTTPDGFGGFELVRAQRQGVRG